MLQAESLGCYSLRWSESASAAPGMLAWRFPQPCKGVTSVAQPCHGLSGLLGCDETYLGLRSSDSLQPRLSQDGLSALRCRRPRAVSPRLEFISPKTAKNPSVPPALEFGLKQKALISPTLSSLRVRRGSLCRRVRGQGQDAPEAELLEKYVGHATDLPGRYFASFRVFSGQNLGKYGGVGCAKGLPAQDANDTKLKEGNGRVGEGLRRPGFTRPCRLQRNRRRWGSKGGRGRRRCRWRWWHRVRGRRSRLRR